MEKYQKQVDAFVGVCHRLAALGYVASHGGNLAWRLEENLILITPTRKFKGDVGGEDVVFIDAKGNTVEGSLAPTGEKPMYLGFFSKRPDIVSVIHCHSPSVCAMAILRGRNWLMAPVFPETTIEIGPVPLVPYAEPLTDKLAERFAPLLPKYNAFVMENHGGVVMSRGDIGWTMHLVEELEISAASILAALGAGKIKTLPRGHVADLAKVMKIRGLPLCGAPGVNSSLEGLYF